MKTVLVTGATDGIGLRTAERLAEKGFNLLIHGRNEDKCKQVCEKLNKLIGKEQTKYYVADFSSLSSVIKMANRIISDEVKLNVLINNAGVYMKELKLTEDGFETTFQVNHLAPFILTNLLQEILLKNKPARIINVSSVAHTNGIIDFENLNGEKRYDSYAAYSQSKLANVLFTYYLADKLASNEVTVNCLHPGVISTKLLHAGFNIPGGSLDEGSDTSVYLASSDEVEGITGKYFDRRKIVPSSNISFDKELQKQLWDLSAGILSNYMN